MFNHIIAVGSVDGVLTAAAALSLCPSASVEFTQAFTVNALSPETWEANRQVLFVDLAVNNQDAVMTIDFVRRVLDAGHKIVGICDEHDAAAWQAVFTAVGINLDSLIVKPCSQRDGGFSSSGALLAATFADTLGDHAKALCADADAADRMDFSGPFASVANQAVKSKIQDNSRRVHIAQVFSASPEADEMICGWIKEYDQILATHAELIENREDLGAGIIRIDARNKIVDMTTLMGALYKVGKVVIVIGESYDKAVGAKVLKHSIGVQGKEIDILSAIKGAGINAGGFAQKANVDPEDAEQAVQVVRQLIAG